MGSAGIEPVDSLEAIDFAVQRAKEDIPTADTKVMHFVLLLDRVTNLLTYDLESTAHRPRGLSWPAFLLMFTLWAGGEVESRVAAARTGMSRAAVSSLTNTLENVGLIRRSADKLDKRKTLLSLTDKGRLTFQDTFEAHRAQEVKWAADLSPADLDQLINLLGKVGRVAQSEWVNRRD
ncbi:MarR family winged helix-turn-helix transcriptional regulator [Arthrobacter sp. StoSoilB20]|uniref:MarR family winged helix-turn-helix transcriptional regulator n=1 Tax=Arthrobacter sp. StoSoilB20 TaxID=2830995 RepID=UPI001CC5E22D|nr:MarR family winged helix-turn-helix transcriptional regulator [Arthrobacter sp. StoSoilB20]BCW58559.1 MarR family transcriptional regulator [Arthrobacter sp. StoSoilB20]